MRRVCEIRGNSCEHHHARSAFLEGEAVGEGVLGGTLGGRGGKNGARGAGV